MPSIAALLNLSEFCFYNNHYLRFYTHFQFYLSLLDQFCLNHLFLIYKIYATTVMTAVIRIVPIKIDMKCQRFK